MSPFMTQLEGHPALHVLAWELLTLQSDSGSNKQHQNKVSPNFGSWSRLIGGLDCENTDRCGGPACDLSTWEGGSGVLGHSLPHSV